MRLITKQASVEAFRLRHGENLEDSIYVGENRSDHPQWIRDLVTNEQFTMSVEDGTLPVFTISTEDGTEYVGQAGDYVVRVSSYVGAPDSDICILPQQIAQLLVDERISLDYEEKSE